MRAAWLAGFTFAVLAVAGPLSGQDRLVSVGANVHLSASRPDLVHVEPTIAASPCDPSRLVAASMVVRRPRSPDFQDSWSVRVYASRDGGGTWRERSLPGLTRDWAAGDPWLTWSGDDVAYLSMLVTPSFLEGDPISTWVYRSTDGGWTWSGPERGVFGSGREVDHPVVTTATAPDGSGRSVVVGTRTDGRREGVSLAVGSREARFRPLPAYSSGREGTNLGDAVALDGGGLLFTYFTMSAVPHGFWAVHRSAGGAWSETRIREAILPVGFPTLALDRTSGAFSGRVYAAWVEGADPLDQVDVSVWLSSTDDEGTSWSPPVRVHQRAPRSRRTLPSIAVNGDGVVAVTWADARNVGERSDCTDLYAAVSMDGGVSFTPEIRISDTTSCIGTPANGAVAHRWRLGGGDYLGLAADADGRFHTVWADSRTGSSQLWTSRFRMASVASNAGGTRSRESFARSWLPPRD